MRISKSIFTVFFILISQAVSAHAELEQTPIVENTTHYSTEVQDDSARLSQCEKEISQLIGRVEILEHAVHELQKTQNAQAAPTVSVSQDVQAPTSAVSTEITHASTDTAQEKRDYDTALAALKESNFVEAENLFNSFMQKYPNSSLISNAYFWYAESFYRRGEFDKAAVHYLKGYKQFPKASKAADSLLKLALSLGEIKKTKEACVILTKLEEEFKQRPASSIKRAYDAKMKYGCK